MQPLAQRRANLEQHGLRAFRHFFRHAYGVRLRSGRVQEDVTIARQLQPLLKHDVKRFLEQLGIDYAD